jgi:nitrate reductase assembly molybdenum cofactor insertion protein NarJ
LTSKPTKTVDKKNTKEILKEADPDATSEEVAKFMKWIEDLMKYLNVNEDPYENIIETIRKIESNLNHYAEARNHLVLK